MQTNRTDEISLLFNSSPIISDRLKRLKERPFEPYMNQAKEQEERKDLALDSILRQ